MTEPALPPAHDLVRLLRPTREEMAEAFRDYFVRDRKPIIWTYAVARALSGDAFGQNAPFSALRHAVKVKTRTAGGQAANLEVLELVWEQGNGRAIQSYAPPPGRPYHVRADLNIRGVANFYYVEAGKPIIVFVQPRRGCNPTEAGLALLAKLMSETLAQDNFDDAELEIFDFSTGGGEQRLSRVLRPADLPSVTEAELTAAMQLIADAYDDVMRMGIDWGALRQQRRDTAAEWARRRDARKRDDQGDIFE